MDSLRLGLGVRALRRRRGWTQDELARKAGLSQASISRAETGGVRHLTVGTLHRIAEALGARVSVRLYWNGADLDRLLDAAHAGLVDEVLRLLAVNGWEAFPEVTFNEYGERGSIDILAWHPGHGALLIVEVKSAVPDIQAMLAGVDRKARIAKGLAAQRGWRVRSISRLIVLPEDRTARRRIAAHEATFERTFPARTRRVRRWIATPTEPIAGILFLSSIHPVDARHGIRVRDGR